MKFKIGPWAYRVYLSTEEIIGSSGDRLDGLCHWTDRRLLLSADLDPEQRLDTLLYLLAQAWEEHLGSPSTSDHRSKQMSSFCVDVWRQLAAQGGEKSLMELWPLPTEVSTPFDRGGRGAPGCCMRLAGEGGAR